MGALSRRQYDRTLLEFMRLISLLAFAISTPLQSADWPHWRGPNYDGTSAEIIPSPLTSELPVRWKAQIGVGFSSVSVSGDRVLTMGNRTLASVETDTIWCLSAKTGEVLWEHSYPCPLDPLYYEGGPSATPSIHKGSVYTLSKKGHVHCLDLESGKQIWSRDLVRDHQVALPEWSFSSSPFLDGDRVLLNVGSGGIALDRETGKTLWLSSTGTSGYATIVPFGAGSPGANHLLFSAKSLLFFDSVTGNAASKFPWKSSRDVNAADPVVIGDSILLSSASGSIRIKPRREGGEPEVVWEQKDLKWYFNPGVLVGDHVYSIHGTTHRPTELVCLDSATGKIVWSEPGFGSGGLSAAGNTVIVFDNGQLTLFEADPSAFRKRHQQKILEGKCWTTPVLAGGNIYCRNASGDLACVEVVAEREP